MKKAKIFSIGIKCPYCGRLWYRDLDSLEIIKITLECSNCGNEYKLIFKK